MPEFETFLDAALILADTARALSVKAWTGDLTVKYKLDGSSITPADLAIEERWREIIRRQFPTHGILGEEYGVETGQSAYTWVLDPIDGTRAFGAGLLNYTSLISLCRDGVPVLGIVDLPLPTARYVGIEGAYTTFAGRPARTSGRTDLSASVIGLGNPDSFKDDSVAGYRGLRNKGRIRVFDGGSPAYGALSRGLIDVCLNGDDLEAFDICALCPVVQGAGGIISDWNGQPLTLASSGAIVASASRGLHSTVLDILSRRE